MYPLFERHRLQQQLSSLIQTSHLLVVEVEPQKTVCVSRIQPAPLIFMIILGWTDDGEADERSVATS